MTPGRISRSRGLLPPAALPAIDRRDPINADLIDDIIWPAGAGPALNLAAPQAPIAVSGAVASGYTAQGPGGATSGGAYYAIPDHVNYAAGDLTCRVLVYVNSWPAAYTTLVDKGTGSDPNRELSIFFDTNGSLNYLSIGGFGGAAVIPTDMTAGFLWDFVLIRTLSSGTVQCYANGKLAGSVTGYSATAAVSSVTALGANVSTGGVNGSFVYLRAQTWNRVLSAAEIARLYAEPWAGLLSPRDRLGTYLVGATGSSLTLVGTATASATTVTPPTHQAGDIIIIFAFRRGSTTPPSLPAGWTSVLAKSGSTVSGRLGYLIATGTNDSSGTWTNATELTCHIYRPPSGFTAGIGASASNSATINTVNYPGLTLVHSSGTSWVAGFIGTDSPTQTIATAPTGMTNESSLVGSNAAIAGHDTEGGVTSWPSTNVTTTGTAGDSVSATVEIAVFASTALALVARGIALSAARAAVTLMAALSGRGTATSAGRASATLAIALAARGAARSVSRAMLSTGAILALAARGAATSSGRAVMAFALALGARGTGFSHGGASLSATVAIAARGAALSVGRAVVTSQGAITSLVARGFSASGARAALTLTSPLLGKFLRPMLIWLKGD